MSAPLTLTIEDLRELADALDLAGQMRNRHGVALGGHGGPPSVVISDVELDLFWREDTNEYVIDDRVGN